MTIKISNFFNPNPEIIIVIICTAMGLTCGLTRILLGILVEKLLLVNASVIPSLIFWPVYVVLGENWQNIYLYCSICWNVTMWIYKTVVQGLEGV